MHLTTEQQTIHDYVLSHDGLTMVSAVAGSGKTSLLTSISKSFTCKIIRRARIENIPPKGKIIKRVCKRSAKKPVRGGAMILAD